MRKRNISGIFVILLMLLLLASCGTEAQDATTTTSSPANTTATSAPTASQTEGNGATAVPAAVKPGEAECKAIVSGFLENYGMDMNTLTFYDPIPLYNIRNITAEAPSEYCVDVRDGNGKEVYFRIDAATHSVLGTASAKSLPRQFSESSEWKDGYRFFGYSLVRTGSDSYYDLYTHTSSSLKEIEENLSSSMTGANNP